MAVVVLIDHLEIWKPIPFLPSHEASEFGHIRRQKDGKIWPQHLDRCGYFTITVGRRRYRTSRAVCGAFHGPCPSSEHLALHSNGNKADNRALNLRWGTQKENCADKELHGRTLHGSLNPLAKITEADAVAIRSRCFRGRGKGGENQRLVAAEYGITQAAVSLIVRRKSWRRV